MEEEPLKFSDENCHNESSDAQTSSDDIPVFGKSHCHPEKPGRSSSEDDGVIKDSLSNPAEDLKIWDENITSRMQEVATNVTEDQCLQILEMVPSASLEEVKDSLSQCGGDLEEAVENLMYRMVLKEINQSQIKGDVDFREGAGGQNCHNEPSDTQTNSDDISVFDKSHCHPEMVGRSSSNDDKVIEDSLRNPAEDLKIWDENITSKFQEVATNVTEDQCLQILEMVPSASLEEVRDSLSQCGGDLEEAVENLMYRMVLKEINQPQIKGDVADFQESADSQDASDFKDQFDSSQENGSFLGLEKGFLLSTGSPEIPDVSPHCSQHCFVDNPDVLLQRISSGKRTKEEDILESSLQKQTLEVHVGAGKVEKCNFDDANKRYMSVYFNDLNKSTYCCPPVFEYKHPGEPFELDEKGNVSSFPKRKVGIDTLHRERRGEHAEEHTVETFSTMFIKYGIPSFIIHGYNWKKQYLDVLKKLSKNISKLSTKVFKKEGEIDLLISLPGKCLLVVEVKAVDKQHGGKEIVKVVTKAFSQCAKIAEFLSKMIRLKDPFCLIKVVVLPNCTRATVNRLFCMICRAHIISADDLSVSDTSELNNWFKRLTGQYSIQIKNSPLQLSGHLNIIGRLIGPASLTGSNTPIESIERTAEQIGEHGGLEKVREIMKWNQLTPQQLYVKWKDPKFLILFGPPGSGKTLLALSKAKEILEGGNGPGSVLYILVNNYTFGLMNMYKDELSKVQHGNCEFIISEYNLEGSLSEEYSKLLALIITLKKKHPSKTLHVICDEFKSPSLLVENPLVGMEEVGYVWLLVDPLYDVPPEHQKEYRRLVHGFEVIFLDWVMRMSRQNIKLANAVIQFILKSMKGTTIEIPRLRAGHAINGVRPSVYRMKCVCREPRGDYICSRCIYIRINWLLIKAYYDIGLDLLKDPDQDHSALGLSLIDLYSVAFNTNESTTMLHFVNYRGCEDKVVIMNLSNLLDLYKLLIGLTRSLGKIIILDGGCSPQEAPKYDEFINMITENIGIVEVKEVRPSEDDLKLMCQAWVLGIGQKVMEASTLRNEKETKEISYIASYCGDRCFVDNPDVLLETIISKKRTKEERILESYLQKAKLKVHFGAGKEEEISFNEANKTYLSLHFPDIDRNAYCCPPVFEYKDPSEPFDLDERGDVFDFPRRKAQIDTLHRVRGGEHAEEQTVKSFFSMFQNYGIPSFIIHGYKWKMEYLNVLQKLSKGISRLSKQVFKNQGEIDLLIALPARCLIAAEVKAVSKQHGENEISRVVEKAFTQCSKTAKFMSKIIMLNEPVSLIKVVVLPNCTQATVDKLFCMICRGHIVSADALSSLPKLNSWFNGIISQYSSQIRNSSLQLPVWEDIIGRLIGPASLNTSNTKIGSIERTAEQIERHGTMEDIKEIVHWDQLTPQQLSAKWINPQYLLLFGAPGSGKTLLALWKAKEILESETSEESVLYILVDIYSRELAHWYRKKLSTIPRGNCEFYVEHYVATGDFTKFVDYVKTLRDKHQGKVLHVICDEFNDSQNELENNPFRNMETIGYIWLLFDPFFDILHEQRNRYKRDCKGFEVVCLDWVMRMSRQNIDFANAIFQRTPKSFEVPGNVTNIIPLLKAGHAINGPRPTVYRMKCVCVDLKDNFTCFCCTYVRVRSLQEVAQSDLGLDFSTNLTEDPRDSVLTLINYFQMAWRDKELSTMPFKFCRGHENYIVIMTVLNLLNFYERFIGLTRSLGKLVILDGGCPTKDIPEYNHLMNVLTDDIGLVEIKEIKPSEEELLSLQVDWVYRLEEEIGQIASKYKLDEVD